MAIAIPSLGPKLYARAKVVKDRFFNCFFVFGFCNFFQNFVNVLRLYAERAPPLTAINVIEVYGHLIFFMVYSDFYFLSVLIEQFVVNSICCEFFLNIYCYFNFIVIF